MFVALHDKADFTFAWDFGSIHELGRIFQHILTGRGVSNIPGLR